MNVSNPRIRTFSMDLPTYELIAELAASEDRTKIAVIRRAIAAYAKGASNAS